MFLTVLALQFPEGVKRTVYQDAIVHQFAPLVHTHGALLRVWSTERHTPKGQRKPKLLLTCYSTNIGLFNIFNKYISTQYETKSI